MAQPTTSAPQSPPRDVRIQIDEEVNPVQSEITEADPVQRENRAVNGVQNGEIDGAPGESREVDPVQALINDFIKQENVYKYKNDYCLQLHKAAVNGDFKTAESLIPRLEIVLQTEGSSLPEKDKCRPNILYYPITETGKTVLHVAAGAKKTQFVEKMSKFIEPEVLKLHDKSGNNAFCFAAMAGAKEIAVMMLHKNPDLLRIRGGANKTPLYLAALFGQRDMASFLYDKYEGEVEDIRDVFFVSVRYSLYDLALKLLELDNKKNKLALLEYEGHGTALHMLAQTPSAFTSRGNNLINHQMDLSTHALDLLRYLWNDIKDLKRDSLWRYMNANKKFLFDAAELGNSQFLSELINFYPDLVRILDDKGRTIFHNAILHRHATIFNLMSDLGFDKQFIVALQDDEGNNLLHLAGKYLNCPRSVDMVPGAALLMQQELKTFKKVELLVMPSYREMKNKDGLTPRELFTKEHKRLLKEGEDWMKKTAKACMLVATIITTVVFTAAFNVPGDYNDRGIPHYLENVIFCSFTVADAVALSSASVSILMFLSILTSTYDEKDFLKSLPLKLMAGLITLFISIATMMLSFSLSFFLAYSKVEKISYTAIPILICIFVFGPVILFIFLQRRLLKDMFYSTLYSLFSRDQIDN